MILSVHVLAGAALSSRISNPILLAPAAMTLHLACDVAPHWEYDFMETTKKKAAAKIAGDIAVGIAVMLITLHGAPLSRITLALWGGFFGILPDGITALYLLSGKKLFRRFTRFHIFCHTLIVPEGKHPPAWLGILTQSAIVATSLFLLAR